MLRTMTFDDPRMSMCPWISAPHSPTMVLFDPMRIDPFGSTPVTSMTAAPVPPAAELSAATVDTIVGVAVPPPVVLPETVAHPTSALAAGGVAQFELEPPVPVVPVPAVPPAAVPPVPLPAAPPRPVVPPPA